MRVGFDQGIDRFVGGVVEAAGRAVELAARGGIALPVALGRQMR
ncbi:hypothetical protein [Candidatus Burkholderia verschuerenii]|nr:hypothetical protein [Candidatus Burkholderia verschuerenii]